MADPFHLPILPNSDHLPNNIVYDHRAYLPGLDRYLESDKVINNNILFYMDKESFCSFMKTNGYALDKIKMEPEAKTLKFTNNKYTIFFQNVIIDNKRLYCIMMISYKTGPIASIIYDRDGSMYEMTYRSDEHFHIKTKRIMSIHQGTIHYQMTIHNSLHSKCYLEWIMMVNGRITVANYVMKGKGYSVNKMRNALGQDEIDLSLVNDYHELVNLFTDDEATLIEIALC